MRAEVRGLVFGCVATLLSACGGGGGGGGGGAADIVQPTVTGAIAQTNTSVLVSFSEPMNDSIDVAGNFSVVVDNGGAGGVSLPVLSATASQDRATVVLQTTSQGTLNYRVTAINVKDAAGNIIAQKESGVGSAVDPASAVFAGIPPSLVEITVAATDGVIAGWQDVNTNGKIDAGDGISDAQGNTMVIKDADGDGVIDNWVDLDGNGVVSGGDKISGLLDSDLDGLLDNEEAKGWTVTVVLQNGTTTTRQVTSDPLKADTDGDKVSDFEEATNQADPRSGDTDGDGLSDFDEWNVVLSSMTNQDGDGDGLSDLVEYQYNKTSPTLKDTDGDGISDAEELDQNRNPRIADRPVFSIDVKEVQLTLVENYSYTDEKGSTTSVNDTSTATLSQDSSVTVTDTDSGVDEATGHVETQLEAGYDATSQQVLVPPVKAIATVGGGASWTNSRGWQTEKTSAQDSSQIYETSLTKNKELAQNNSYTRNVTGAKILLTVDVINKGDFTLTFSNITISALKREGAVLVPITTLSDTFGTLELSPLDSGGKGVNLIFESTDVSAADVEDLMKNVPGLVFQVSNYQVTDNTGVSFASSDQDVFNATAGIVIDSGDNANVQRFLVSVAGSQDFGGIVGGGWQGGVEMIDGQSSPRGVSLDYAMQDILKLTRHYRYDTIEAGSNGSLDTAVDPSTDDELAADGTRILPGANHWIDTQPTGDDVLKSLLTDRSGQPTTVQQGIIAGPDLASGTNSVAVGDDVQLVPPNTTGIPYGTVIVSAGDNGILESTADSTDIVEYVGGYETSRSCVDNESTIGKICKLNKDCDTPQETQGACTGPERIARIGNLRSGDDNREWYVFLSDGDPTAADFSRTVIKHKQIYRLAFLQDLDRDGLTSRTEKLYGSIDSAANRVDNSKFGVNFDLAAELANGPGSDVFPDSKDSDGDGLSDYAEIKVGWKVPDGKGNQIQVYPNPGLADSDGDGLKDPYEMDLRSWCGNDVFYVEYGAPIPRTNGMCAFLDQTAVTQADATAIVAGFYGVAESTPAGDDVVLHAQGSTGLQYGTATILPGDNGVMDTTLSGHDVYVNANSLVPRSHPRLADTDGDGLSDYDETTLQLLWGVGVYDGGNGIAETTAAAGDLALAIPGGIVEPGSFFIAIGPDGILDTTTVGGDDRIFYGSEPSGVGQYRRSTAWADPLLADTDGDLVNDGVEVFKGTNPAVRDSLTYADTDGDGLPDSFETAGWTIIVDGTQTKVTSNPDVGDTDGDGLPDLVEYQRGTDPSNSDTDGDGLSDYEEFTAFDTYKNYSSLYPGFTLANDPMITHYSTSPTNQDSDGDGLTDNYEVTATYGTNNDRKTDPWIWDTDGDGLRDSYEGDTSYGWEVSIVNGSTYTVRSDPTLADTDGDGLNDREEFERRSDPNKANTDDDVYGVTDSMELKLGTNPLDPDDRCTWTYIDNVKLVNGVDSTDTEGGVANTVRASVVNASNTILTPPYGVEKSYRGNLGVGATHVFGGDPLRSTLKKSEKVQIESAAQYQDIFDFALSPWSQQIKDYQYATQDTDFSATSTTEKGILSTYNIGNIKIETRARVLLKLNAANGTETCK